MPHSHSLVIPTLSVAEGEESAPWPAPNSARLQLILSLCQFDCHVALNASIILLYRTPAARAQQQRTS